MNIIEKYLALVSPVKMEDVSPVSFMKLKENGWYRDSRASSRFEILSKRIMVNDNWYRVMVRFKKVDSKTYSIDNPIPFLVVECEEIEDRVFKENVVHHGRSVGNALGYLSKGIPSEVLGAVIQDLKSYLIYKNTKRGNEIEFEL